MLIVACCFKMLIRRVKKVDKHFSLPIKKSISVCVYGSRLLHRNIFFFISLPMEWTDENREEEPSTKESYSLRKPRVGSLRFNIELTRSHENIGLQDNGKETWRKSIELDRLPGFHTIVSTDQATVTSKQFPSLEQRHGILANIRNSHASDGGSVPGSHNQIIKVSGGSSTKGKSSDFESDQENEVFYETSPVQYGFDEINSLVAEVQSHRFIPSLIEDENPMVEFLINPILTPLIPGNAALDLSVLDTRPLDMKMYGPLHDVIEFDENEVNDEAALLFILDFEDAIVHQESTNEPQPQPLARRRWRKFFSLFGREEDQEEVKEQYFQSWPWSRYTSHVYESTEVDKEQFSYLSPVSILNEF